VFQTTGDENLGHGAQKPISAWADLLKRSAKPGDAIIDPFAGSGGLLSAGHNAGCNVTLIEQEAEYYGICLQRLQDLI
jgi:DNA modification methylase